MDQLNKPVLEPGHARLDRSETLQRESEILVFDLALFLGLFPGNQLGYDLGIGEVLGLRGGAATTSQPAKEFEQGAPISLPGKPIIEIEPEDLLQVPAQGRPVSADDVYEAAVPPGTSLTPGPRNRSHRYMTRPIISASESG